MDNRKTLIEKFWKYFDNQDYEATKKLLHPDFKAIWNTTSELFPSREAIITVNRAYPGKWFTKLQRVDLFDQGAVSVVFIYSDDNEAKTYAISFYTFKDGLISEISDYYAAIEEAPEWRNPYSQEYHIKHNI
jgi:hypothetical protein